MVKKHHVEEFYESLTPYFYVSDKRERERQKIPGFWEEAANWEAALENN
jgi:hypothetical protein